jgi:hypothetical protein
MAQRWTVTTLLSIVGEPSVDDIVFSWVVKQRLRVTTHHEIRIALRARPNDELAPLQPHLGLKCLLFDS